MHTLFSARKWQVIWSKDWVLKLISIFLATLLWYFVGGEDIVDKNVMVPIEIINLPRDLVISNQFKKEIEVTVSGPRSVIQDMANKAVSRQINLATATPGTNVIENDNNSITVPRGITVLRIQPSSIILSLDKLIQKQFTVKPVTTGEVASGFEMLQLVMNPDVITITGPETILSQADTLITDIIDISGLKESKQIQVPLDLEPSFIDLIGETSITADITVKPKMVEKKVSKVQVVASLDGQEREVAPKTVDIIARIPVLLIKEGPDLKKLFLVTAFGGQGNDDFLKVSAIPREDIPLPIEIVSIIPSSVKLVREAEEVENKVPADAIPKEGSAEGKPPQEPAVPKASQPASEPHPPTIEEETSGSGNSEVKILSAKRKKILRTEQKQAQ